MAYLVIAYPELQQSDFDWIQTYRRQNDRQFSLVEPHFSIVFAVSDLDKDSFLNEVKQKIGDITAFDVDLKVATINKDNSGNYYHEFLVPDTGYSDIVKLHDKLYSGLLAPYLRFDVDFIPHISIGDSEDAQISKKRVDELNAQGVSIHGRIGSVDVIEYADGAVSTVEKIELKAL
ncbi:MAG TPA: 2'-5' RNA ligase family protein [Candidatus Chromulinivoraceae bacterium]|nr:2'-5' RNA ligase family protein [Candidatus Chromulinivoraceae bacterium]